MLTYLTLTLSSVLHQRSPYGAELGGRSCDAPSLEGSRLVGSEARDLTFFQGAQARSVAAACGGAVAAPVSPGSRAIFDEGLGSSGLLMIGSRVAAVRDELLAVHHRCPGLASAASLQCPGGVRGSKVGGGAFLRAREWVVALGVCQGHAIRRVHDIAMAVAIAVCVLFFRVLGTLGVAWVPPLQLRRVSTAGVSAGPGVPLRKRQ